MLHTAESDDLARRPMSLVAGLLGERAARLLVTLLVLHSLKVATSAVSLSVMAPLISGGVEVTDSAKSPLLAIVRCSNGNLSVGIRTFVLFSNESLQVQVDKSSNNPNESFVLPSNTHTVFPEGVYEMEIVCHSLLSVEERNIHVNVITVVADSVYFTDTLRYVNVSASSPPGTVVVTYKAEFGEGSTVQQYVVREDYMDTPFQLNSSSGELAVSQSLQMEGTLSKYDIVVVADRGNGIQAWTVTTITIVAGCVINNVAYSVGDAVPNTNPCKSCVCAPGQPDQQRCAVIACAIPVCGECGLDYDPDQCCPSCKRECNINNVTYCEGDVVSNTTCETCTCDPDASTLQSCIIVDCFNFECPDGQKLKYLPDQCCPICVSAAPECTFRWCKRKKNALCTISDATGNCTCKLSSCKAAYYSENEREAPPKCSRKNRCTDLTGERLKTCLKKWGNCVKKSFRKQHGRTPANRRQKDFFKSLEYPCGG